MRSGGSGLSVPAGGPGADRERDRCPWRGGHRREIETPALAATSRPELAPAYRDSSGVVSCVALKIAAQEQCIGGHTLRRSGSVQAAPAWMCGGWRRFTPLISCISGVMESHQPHLATVAKDAARNRYRMQMRMGPAPAGLHSPTLPTAPAEVCATSQVRSEDVV